MTETKYSPGPWILLPPSQGIDKNWHVTNQADTFVAHVYGFAHAVDEQSRVNARLIAAAPELLEALEVAENCLAGGGQEGATLRIVRAAISKARAA